MKTRKRDFEADYKSNVETLLSRFPGMAYRCLHDADWSLEYVSEGSSALLGYTPRQLVEEKVVAISDLVHPEDLERVSLAVEKALARREPFSIIYRMATADDAEKWIWEQGQGSFNSAGDLLALEGFLTDITARIHAERSQLETQKLNAVGRLAGGIAHDFNNLLTVILASADHLLTGGKNSGWEDDVKAMQEAAKRAAAMTKQLLSFSNPGDARVQSVDLNVIVSGMRDLLGRLLGDGTEVTYSWTAQPLVVRIDPARMEQVVLNLAVNARDAMAGQGRIRISLSAETIEQTTTLRERGHWALLSVRDEGCGIAPELMKSLFEPYFTTKNTGSGTGLGLAVVDNIVRQSGGDIEVRSEPGEGTEFRIWLPAQQELPDKEQAEVADLAGGDEVILVVEDDDMVRRSICNTLSSLGYAVLQAANGRQAIHVSERHKGRLDLLLTDFEMPGINGVVLAEILGEVRPAMKTVLVSGYVHALPAGQFDAVIAKPLARPDLARLIRATLDSQD